MRSLTLPAALLLLCLAGSGLCREEASGRPDGETPPVPETTGGACRTIAAILSVYPTFDVRASEGTVRDLLDGSGRPGCRVHASGPAWGVEGEVAPGEAIRTLLGGAGWKEVPHYSADGPGTTSFALRDNGVLCMFSGGAHSWIEDGKIMTAERYEFEAGCIADPAGAAPVPGR